MIPSQVRMLIIAMIAMGRANERIAGIQESYVAHATSYWLEGLERSLAMMKEYQVCSHAYNSPYSFRDCEKPQKLTSTVLLVRSEETRESPPDLRRECDEDAEGEARGLSTRRRA
jgi:hypothetical protein